MGGVCGWIFGREMLIVDWIGEMFLDALKMLVIPLIISSMIVGITGLGDIRKVGKTGTITLVYFLSTSGMAVLVGIVVVNIIQPGLGVELIAGFMQTRLQIKYIVVLGGGQEKMILYQKLL